MIITSNKGSASIVIVLLILVASSIAFLQQTSLFSKNNLIHSRKRNFDLSTKDLQNLGLIIKKSLTMGQVDPSCASTWDASLFEPITINGFNFCKPRSTGFCVNSHMSGNVVCASSNLASIRVIPNASQQVINTITNAPLSAGTPSLSNNTYSNTTGMNNKVRTIPKTSRITIPNTSSSHWKSCVGSGNLCLKILICPSGMTDCNLNQSVAQQIIHLTAY